MHHPLHLKTHPNAHSIFINSSATKPIILLNKTKPNRIDTKIKLKERRFILSIWSLPTQNIISIDRWLNSQNTIILENQKIMQLNPKAMQLYNLYLLTKPKWVRVKPQRYRISCKRNKNCWASSLDSRTWAHRSLISSQFKNLSGISNWFFKERCRWSWQSMGTPLSSVY